MVEPLRILILEDVPSDAALEQRELRRAGLEFVARCVETEPELLAALADFKPDIVLSDYSLPSFNGMAALRLVQQRSPTTPVIIVTGTLDEETAAECIKAGAADYVLKERLARLPVAVRSALERSRLEQDKRRAEEAWRHSEAEQRAFFNAGADGLFIKDAALRTVMANPAYAAFLGRPVEEILGRDDFELMPEAMARACRESDLDALRRKIPCVTEERADGRVFESRKFPVPLADGSVGLGGYIRDVTERNRAEEELRKSKGIIEGILDAMPVRVFWKDKNLVYLGCNAIFARDAGFAKAEDIIGKDDYQMGWRDQAEAYRADDRQVIESGCSKVLQEEPQTTPEGSTITLLTSKLPLRSSNGEVSGVLGTYLDITDRKRVEEALRESEKRFRQLAETMPDAVVVGQQGRNVYANSAAARLLRAAAPEELVGLEILAIVDPAQHGRAWQHMQRALAGEKQPPFEDSFVRLDGSVVPVEISVSLLTWLGGPAVQVVLRDITERKRAEAALLESEAELRAMFEVASIGIAQADPSTGRWVRVNQKMCAITGYSCEELLGLRVRDITHPDDRQEDLELFQRVVRGEVPDYRLEKRYLRKDGSVVWVNVNMTVVRDQDGRPIRTIATIEDINDRKRVENQLRSSEARFRSYFDLPLHGIGMSSTEKRWTQVNDRLCSILGYSRDELLKMDWSEMTHPEDLAADVRWFERILSGELEHYNMEKRFIRKDGQLIWASLSVGCVRKPDGGVDYLVVLVEDISEKKAAEEALKKSERRLEDILFSMADWVWEVDEYGVYTYSSSSGAERFGDVIGKTPFDFMAPDEAKRIGAIFSELVANKAPIRGLENWNIGMDGAKICLLSNGVPILDNEGNFRGYRGVDQDITERKRAEDALRASEERYRLIAENSADVIWTLDLATRRLTYVSPSVWRLRGFTPEEVLAQPFAASLTPDSLSRVNAYLAAALAAFAAGDQSAAIGTIEVEMPTKDGGVVQTEVVATALTEASGRVTGVLGVTRDITERKRAEAALQESERQLVALMANVPGMVYRCAARPGWPMEFVSEGCAALTGWSSAEVMRQQPTFSEMVVEEERQGVGEAVEAAVARHEPFELNYRIKRADGRVRWVWERGSGVFGPGGRLSSLEGFVTDVTAQKTAESAVRESEARYRSLFDQSPIGIYRTTPDGRILVANPALVEMLGYASPDELTARNLEETGFEPDYPRRAFKERLEREGEVRGFETLWTREDGSRLHVRESAQPIRDVNGKILYYEGAVEDVTSERKAQQELQRSEAQYRHLFEGSNDAIVVFEPESETILDANPKACDLYGYTRGELVGGSFKRLTLVVARGERRIADLVRDKQIADFETIHVRRDGTPVTLQISASFVDYRGATAILSSARDVTHQKESEEERKRLVAAIEQSAEGVLITDRGGVILYVNPAFEWITGYLGDEVLGLNPRFLKSGKQGPSFYAEMWATIARGSVWTGKLSNRRKDGALYEEEMSISPIRDEDGTIINYVAVKRDITRELELQQQLAQAQKMEAVGRLAGGVAHDFNNLLQALITHVELLRGAANDPEKVVSSSRVMGQLIGHGASLTRQLLLFSRRETVRPERLDLNEQVREASTMLNRLVKDNIALKVELAPKRLEVDADRGQLDQVLMNLVVNASDAMPDGGDLTIRTGATNNTRVWLSVEDKGNGIPEEIRERIFEPFFTTKGPGKGTGLGLAVVDGIVTRHGGTIEVESEVGRGTTFTVSLPASGSGEFPAAKEAPKAPAPLAAGKGERVLVVEDEEAARQGLHEILVSFGYRVVSVGSGEAAGSLPADPPFDLLLTDLMLPGVAGPRLAIGLKARWPALKVILMSGYAEDDAIRSDVGEGKVNFLQKPFDMATLAREVRAALDA